jgi:hypothetical protein
MVPTNFKKILFQCELWAAARSVPFRLHRRSFDEILQMRQWPRSISYQGISADYIIESVCRSVRRPLVMRHRRCLREGLLAYWFLQAAGHTPALHFGIDRRTVSSLGLMAHCWVTCDGKIVLNSPGADIVPILSWPNAASAAEPGRSLAHAEFD